MAKIPTDANLISPMGDMGIAVAIGAIKGWAPERKFGMNPAVAAGVQEEIWPLGTIRSLPTAAATTTIVSDSSADTLTSGTGAWTVVVQGLDDDYNFITETVNMAGLTPVNLSQQFRRLFRAYVQYTGSSGYNVGNLTVTIGGVAQAYVEAAEGQTHIAAGTVPAGTSFLINYYSVGVGRMAGNTDAQILGQIRLYDEAGTNNHQSWRTISDVWVYNGQEHTNSVSTTVLPEKTDYRVLISSSAATQAHAIIGGFFITTATQGNF